jgi:hypothetical protein
MTKRTLFTSFPHIGGDDIMINTDFYEWLIRQPKKKIDVFTDTLKAYLGKYGFDITKHILSPDQLKAHRSVFEIRWFNHWENQKSVKAKEAKGEQSDEIFQNSNNRNR